MRKRKIKKNVKVLLIALLAVIAIAIPASLYASNSYTYSTKDDKTTDKAVSKQWVQTSDNTWVMDVNGDGKNDVTLTSSINADGQQEWNYEFAVEDDEQNYYIYEEMTNNGSAPLGDGYTAKGTDHKQAIPQEPGISDNGEYKITNSRRHTSNVTKHGNLKITKNVTGTMSDPDQKFIFTISLSSDDSRIQTAIKGSKVFGDVVFTDGIGKVSLGEDESVMITDLPESVNYTITEDPVDEYENTSKTNDTGTIKGDDTIESVWTNNSAYVPPGERQTNSFTLEKKVTGSAKPDTDKYYQYEVHLENLKINTGFTYTIGSETYDFKSDKNGVSDITLKLKNNERAVFNNVQVDSTYQISEDSREYDEDNTSVDGTFIPSYTVTDANNLNEIITPQATGRIGEKLNTSKETVNDGENVTVTYTNDYPATQSLVLKKYVSKKIGGKTVTTDKESDEYKSLSDNEKTEINKESEKEFEFTVDFTNLPQNAEITSSIGKVVPDEYGEASKTFNLKADGSEIRFVNIPEGTKYQITESKNDDYTAAYEIKTVNSGGKEIEGTVVSNKGDSNSTKTETVEDNQSDIVTFTNNDLGPVIVPTGVKEGTTAALPLLVGIVGIIVIIEIRRKRKFNDEKDN